MSIQDEQEFAGRLRGVLDAVEPSPPPVLRTQRQGRRIRVRRRVGVAAGLAAVIAAAATAPSVLGSRLQQAPAAHPRYRVSVQVPPRSAPSGTIAVGSTNGRRWQMVVSGTQSVTVSGQISSGLSLVSGEDWTSGNAPAGFESGSSGSFWMLVGAVRDDVATLAVRLPDGATVTLTPVSWQGHRWVGLVLPAGVSVSRAVAYSATGGEIAYSVPYAGQAPGAWWAPGQATPARVTRVIGSGVLAGVRWRVTAHIGPWGYCLSDGLHVSECSASASASELLPKGTMISLLGCDELGSGATPALGMAVTAAAVRRVTFEYSNAPSASFPAVAAGVKGVRVLAFVIPLHAHVTGTREYGSARQFLGRTTPASSPSC